MATVLEPFIQNKSKRDRTFFVLLLSEGYISASEFNKHCKLAINQLFTIPPFGFLKKNMEFYRSFVPSVDDGIPDNNSGNTAFKFYVENNQFKTEEPWLIAESIKDLIISFNYALPFIPQNVRDIWLNRRLNPFRLIIILAKYNTKIHTCFFWKYLSEIEDKIRNHYPETEMENREHARAAFPVLTMSCWPWKIDGSTEYTNPGRASACALSQYMGEILGLGIEYENNGSEYQNLTIGEDEVLKFPNLYSYEYSSSSGVPSKEQQDWIPWKNLMKKRLDTGIAIEHHPSAGNVNDFKRIKDTMKNKVVLLSHPNPSSANTLSYNETAEKIINKKNNPDLIEGGLGYRLDVFRPNVECTMRHDGFTLQKPSGKYEAIANPYCKVCRQHVRGRLGSSKNYRYKGVKFKYNPYFPSFRRIDSKVAIKFVEHCNQTYDQYSLSSNGYSCIAATFRRFESFFKDKLKWGQTGEGFYKLELPADAAGPYKGPDMYYPKSPYIDYGISRKGRWYPHNLWASNLFNQREKRNLSIAMNSLAGAGAPGAIAYLGFGAIYNRYEESHFGSETYLHMEQRSYSDLLSDLNNVQPGALLKIVPDWDVYHNIVLYVNGYISAQQLAHRANGEIENGRPKIDGHSLIYMGKKSDGKHIIFDQNRWASREGTLESDWSDYEFIIIGQWFDGENV